MSEHLSSRITYSLLIYQGIFALQIIISAWHAMLCTSLCKGIIFTLFSMTSPFSITVYVLFIDKMSFLCIASCQQCVIDACVSVTCDARERGCQSVAK